MPALRSLLVPLVLLGLATVGASPAAADPVQQFSIQLKDVTADGRYSMVYTANAFDTTGAAPPPLADAWMRLPKGMTIKPAFRRPDRLCEIAKLAGFLFQNRPKGVTYAERVDKFPAGRASIERRLPSGARQTVDTCANAFLGRGTVTVDARPLYPDPIPAKFTVVLSRPTAKGAVAGIGILTHYDRTSPLALDQPRYTLLQPTFVINIFNDPTPDGLYGYRVSLLTQRSAGLRLSIADLRFESRGILGPARRGGGRRDFWATLPTCPASGEVPFKAEYRYTTGVSNTTTFRARCPRFVR